MRSAAVEQLCLRRPVTSDSQTGCQTGARPVTCAPSPVSDGARAGVPCVRGGNQEAGKAISKPFSVWNFHPVGQEYTLIPVATSAVNVAPRPRCATAALPSAATIAATPSCRDGCYYDSPSAMKLLC